MTTEPEAADAAWKALLGPVADAIGMDTDGTQAEYDCAVAVRELLFRHRPTVYPFVGDGETVYCVTCPEARWPCDVYQVIEKASRHGE